MSQQVYSNNAEKYPLTLTDGSLRLITDQELLTTSDVQFNSVNLTGVVLNGPGNYPITFPPTQGVAGSHFQNDGSGNLTWVSPGSGGTGDVVGPLSSVDNRVVRFDGTSGKLIQSSSVTIDDSGNTSGNTFSGSSNSVVAYTSTGSSGTGGGIALSHKADVASLFPAVEVGDVSGAGYVSLGGSASAADVALRQTVAGAELSIANTGKTLTIAPGPSYGDGTIDLRGGSVDFGSSVVAKSIVANTLTFARSYGPTTGSITLDMTGGGVNANTITGAPLQLSSTSGNVNITPSGSLTITSDTYLSTGKALTLTSGTGTVSIAPPSAATSYTMTLPTTVGATNSVLQATNGTGTLAWTSPGSSGVGNVVGPATSIDNTIARFDLTTGKLLQGSTVTIDDSGNLTMPLAATISSAGALALTSGSSGNINLTANGVGTVFIGSDLVMPSTQKIIIGNAGLSGATSNVLQVLDSTGAVTNSTLSTKSIITTSNANLTITPDGTGMIATGRPVDIGNSADTFMRRSAANTVMFDRNGSGTGAITVSTNAGTVSTATVTSAGALALTTAANGNITMTPNGTGVVDTPIYQVNGFTQFRASAPSHIQVTNTSGSTTGIVHVNYIDCNSVTCLADSSVVMSTSSGGVATFAGNVFLPTSGGTATALNYYEEYSSASVTYSGIWAASQTGSLRVTRVGKMVTLWLGAISAIANTASTITVPAATIPTRFVGANDAFASFIRMYFVVRDNGTDKYGNFTLSADGSFRISAGAATGAVFAGSGSSGFFGISLSWNLP